MALTFIKFTPDQLQEIGKAINNNTDISLNIHKDQILEDVIDFSLTKSQLENIRKGKKIKITHTKVKSLGKKMLKKREKTGGFLPLLAALAPILAKTAAVAIPTITGITSAVLNKKHNDRMLAESQRQTEILKNSQNMQGKGMKLRRGNGMRLFPSNLKKN